MTRQHTENELQRAIMLRLSQVYGVVIWRNNTGVDTTNGVRYGLCKGSADLIGICRGQFLAIEVKAPKGRVSPEQERFLALVRSLGGIAVVARSVEDALRAVGAV